MQCSRQGTYLRRLIQAEVTLYHNIDTIALLHDEDCGLIIAYHHQGSPIYPTYIVN